MVDQPEPERRPDAGGLGADDDSVWVRSLLMSGPGKAYCLDPDPAEQAARRAAGAGAQPLVEAVIAGSEAGSQEAGSG